MRKSNCTAAVSVNAATVNAAAVNVINNHTASLAALYCRHYPAETTFSCNVFLETTFGFLMNK